MKKYTNGFTMDVIASCAYGIDVDSINQPDHPIVINAKKILNVDASLSLLICLMFPTLSKYLRLEPFNIQALQYFDDLTSKIIEERTKQSTRMFLDNLKKFSL